MLLRAGPGLPGAMGGDVPLTALELRAWAQGCGINLRPWEFETILAGSHAYVTHKIAGARPDCPAPWQQMPTDEDRPKIAKSIKNLLRN